MIVTASPYTAVREQATRWVRELLERQDWAILDTETTGLGNTAEIIQVAAVDFSGSVLIDALVKPTVAIEPGAYRSHGISQQIVGNANPFDLVFLDLLKAAGGRELVVCNAVFDLRSSGNL